MSHDAINSWVENAKMASKNHAAHQQGIQVVRAKQDKGNIILDLSEKLLPWLHKLLDGTRDNNGMLLQPAHVRAISLEMAQSLVKKHQA
jgi:hypothetical protein